MFTVSGLMTILRPAAELGVLSIAAAPPMIGGEFDLSIGSMVAFAGMVFGAIIGQLVIRTRLHSFIVTLAFLFILRGLSLIGLKAAAGGNTVMSGIAPAGKPGFVDHFFSGDTLTGLFAWMTAHGMIATLPNGQPSVHGVPVSVVWFVALTAFATWLLIGTRFGNWIFAAGGDPNAARNSAGAGRRVAARCRCASAARSPARNASSSPAAGPAGAQSRREATIAPARPAPICSP
jgi:simple sugar transport system permease protein